jgi:hypothetical protein
MWRIGHLAALGVLFISGGCATLVTGSGNDQSVSFRRQPRRRRCTALGIAEATDLFTTFPATFSGQTVDSTSVLVRYTLEGDANLSGNVDTTDFNLLAANFSRAGNWFNGDFDYDGATDTLDFNLLASNFGQILLSQDGDRFDSVLVPEDFQSLDQRPFAAGPAPTQTPSY